MEVLASVLTIFSVIFLILQVFFLVMLIFTKEERFFTPMWIMCALFWACMLGSSICEKEVNKNKETEIKAPQSVEYPAADYTLDYKVTEYQGKRDTTYVITPKIK